MLRFDSKNRTDKNPLPLCGGSAQPVKKILLLNFDRSNDQIFRRGLVLHDARDFHPHMQIFDMGGAISRRQFLHLFQQVLHDGGLIGIGEAFFLAGGGIEMDLAHRIPCRGDTIPNVFDLSVDGANCFHSGPIATLSGAPSAIDPKQGLRRRTLQYLKTREFEGV